MLKSVKVPQQFRSLFQMAEDYVSKYFADLKLSPEHGKISVGDERYILVRSASMSVEFFQTIASLYSEQGEANSQLIARQFLFDVSHAIGLQDAKHYADQLGITDPIRRLSIGPINFAYTGWAFVDILPESCPSMDENYYLIYNHPYSFEADAWIQAKKETNFPVCVMNAGYSSGWCSTSFGLDLSATEILCRAKGDECCRFIMAPSHRIEGHIAAYRKIEPTLSEKINSYEIPGFFKRKELEEKLEKSEALFRTIAETSQIGFFTTDAQGESLYANQRWREISGVYGHITFDSVAAAMHPDDRQETTIRWNQSLKDHLSMQQHLRFVHAAGEIVWALVSIEPIMTKNGVCTGFVGSLTDITNMKLAEEELIRANEELVRAANEIKTLSGLLPICASCKKVRDDTGCWENIEAYVSKRSNADFTHGICPDCAKSLPSNED